jgi:hypothetical protein
LSETERGYIVPASERDDFRGIAEADRICFVELTARQFLRETEDASYTWLMIGAAWCPHVQSDLSLMSKSEDFLRDIHVRPVALYRTYDVAYLRRKCREYDIGCTVGFIPASVYGTDESEKQISFLEELTGRKSSDAVPYHVLLDRRGNVLKERTGSVKDLREFLREAMDQD